MARVGKSFGYAAVTAAAVLATATAALAADPTPTATPTTQEMAQQIQQLQTQVNQLETAQPPAPAKDDSHSPLLDVTPILANYDPSVGFVIRSEDGNFSLHPGLLFDFRNMTTYRQWIPPHGGGETNSTGNDVQNGFDVSRMRLTFDGNFTKNVTYFFQFQDDQGSTFNLFDAYAQYHFDSSPWSIRAGQFKDFLFHERTISETRLLAVDRSLMEALLWGGTVSRTQGVALMYEKDRLRAQALIDDGFASLNTRFFDSGGAGAGVTGNSGLTPTNFGVGGRAEYVLIGDRTEKLNPFSEYDQFSSLGAKQNILVLGGGISYSQASSNDIIFHSLDLQYNNTNGFSAYGGYLATYRDLHTNQGIVPGIYYDPGFVVQAAYLFKNNIEPYIRFDFTHLAPKSTTGLANHDVPELTIGSNYYLYKQNLKFTLDGIWLPNGSPVDSDALGVLRDSGHNEFILRAQLQLAI
jgi:Phosphate-selective porin O and P